MCCAIVALLVALFPAWPGAAERFTAWIEHARWLAPAAAAAVLVAGTALAANHALQRDYASWMTRICGFMDVENQPAIQQFSRARRQS